MAGRSERLRCCRCKRKKKASNRSYCVGCWSDIARERRAAKRSAPTSGPIVTGSAPGEIMRGTYTQTQDLTDVLVKVKEDELTYFDAVNAIFRLFGLNPPGV